MLKRRRALLTQAVRETVTPAYLPDIASGKEQSDQSSQTWLHMDINSEKQLYKLKCLN